jgi:DNA-binding PadR family transcriptional regulator
MSQRRRVNNLLALALLALLASGSPMHPYQMVNVLRRTGKERDIKIKWGSLYTVVQNLEKHGLIEATGSRREGRRPERTVYAITAEGRAEVRDWVRALLTVPEPEYPRFEAALSAFNVLPPDEVAELLARRLATLEAEITAQREGMAQAAAVPRIFLIETEYALAMREAEASWVRRLHGELVERTLPGIDAWQRYHETGEMPPELAAMWTQILTEGGPRGARSERSELRSRKPPTPPTD